MKNFCFVLSYRAHYARLKKLLSMMHDAGHPFTIITGGSMELDRFKAPWQSIANDGFKIAEHLWFDVEGSKPHTMARSLGLAVIEFAGAFERLKPDIVVVQADRYEAMAAALAANTMNIPIVHIQGGELSGSVDDAYRHAITRLATYHCPATERAKERLIGWGIEPSTILTVGCPSSDLAKKIVPKPSNHIVVSYHPDTRQPIEECLADYDVIFEFLERNRSLHGESFKAYLFWPNIDAGSDAISKAIRQWRDRVKPDYVEYVRYMESEQYQQLLADAILLIGNSSSFIRDNSFYGTPTWILGSRQQGRIDDDSNYGDGHVSERMLEAFSKL